MSSHKFTNNLINEKSPYLLVDWYPWGEEAFSKAREENKPIFLSVGYSTCHWCHVMETESFENEDVAEIMNKHFINIKGHEENPGVDKFYMTFVQLQSGGGGWPMSVFLTPDLHPFFGGTYFPPDDVFGRPGFKTLLSRIAQLWITNPDKLKESGQKTVNQLKAYSESRPSGSSSSAAKLVPSSVAETTFKYLQSSYDDKQGGFGKAPKFPTPVQLLFLMDYYGYQDKIASSNNANKALEMALFTLQRISAGGIHDHVGGGFHRYSTDSRWHVPHFEKMLYDQAQLLMAYCRAYQITQDSQYADTARDIVRYVARDLANEEGGFYAAEDADSLPAEAGATKIKEGAFCVWTASELDERLGPDTASLFAYRYGVKKDGNVDPDQDPHNELKGKNVLFEQHTLEDTAEKFGIPIVKVESALKKATSTLLCIRQNERPKPRRDEKILTSWNGLMISGLAQASQALEDDSLLALAIKTATFVRKMYNEDTKRMIRSFCEGLSKIEGFLDDYSYLIQGLIDLYEATLDEQWIQWAHELQQSQDELFYDNVYGGYYSTRREDDSILVRLKEGTIRLIADPWGGGGGKYDRNAVAIRNLTRLSVLLQDTSLSDKARKTIEAFEKTLMTYPFSMPYFVSAFILVDIGIKELLLATNSEQIAKQCQRAINRVFVPNKLLARAVKNGGILAQKNSVIREIASKLEDTDERISVYICENFACGMPFHHINDVLANLDKHARHV
ncbi:Six-hairpin glycosidase-like protein [Dichotomocladium elegans]|nr:Six-hairpin glycosidase-like protein [Dichotomocladium elegans]